MLARNQGAQGFKVATSLQKMAEDTEFMDCPSCKQGRMRLKATRFDTLFIACTNYPSCKNTMSFPKSGVE